MSQTIIAYPAFSVAAVDMWWTSIICTPMAPWWWPWSSVRCGENFVLTFQKILCFQNTPIPPTQSFTTALQIHFWSYNGSYVLHAHISTIHSTHTDTRTPHVASHPTTQFPKSLTSISPSYSATHLPGYEISRMNTKTYTALQNKRQFTAGALQILNKFCLV
jgi:hypothetical protein